MAPLRGTLGEAPARGDLLQARVRSVAPVDPEPNLMGGILAREAARVDRVHGMFVGGVSEARSMSSC